MFSRVQASWQRLTQQETLVVVVLGGLMLLMFSAAGLLTRWYRATEHQIADEWAARAERAVAEQRFPEAVADLRNALVYARNDAGLELRLAKALLSSGQAQESREYFARLWERQPGNGEINLYLARLSARDGEFDAAARYFNNAIYGQWTGDIQQQRQQTRAEFVDYLMQRGALARAAAELNSMATDAEPSDWRTREWIATRLLAAGDHDHAFRLFAEVLRRQRNHEAAWAGAGEAAFRLGRHDVARRYLERVRDRLPDLYRLNEAVLGLDPNRRGVRLAERARRTRSLLAMAQKRVTGCALERGGVVEDQPLAAPFGELMAQAEQVTKSLAPRAVQRNPGLIDTAADTAFHIEREITSLCGAATGEEFQALALLAARAEAQ